MYKLKSFLLNRPIIAFLLLVFIISYLIGISFNLGIKPYVEGQNELMLMYVPIMVTVLGPLLAARLVRKYHKAVSPAFARFSATGKGWLWIIPLVILVLTFGIFISVGVSYEQMRSIVSDHWAWLVGHFFLQFLLVGMGEESGWRGWLLPQLGQRKSLAYATLWLFVIWSLWHFPKLLMRWDISLAFVGIWLSASILMSWIWVKTEGNIWLIALTHAAINAPVFFMENRIVDYQISYETIISALQVLSIVSLLFSLTLFAIQPSRWFMNEDQLKEYKALTN